MSSFKIILKVIFVLLLFSCNKKANNVAEKENLEVVKQDKFPEKPLEEDRSISESEPPIVLDIIEAREKVKVLKCSQFANSIRYVKLSHPFDNEFLKNAKITLTPYDIVVNVEKGIALFDAEGEFIEMICKNGKKNEKSKEGYYFITPELCKKYVGSVGRPMIYGNKIYYKYVNVPQEIGKLMEYIPTYDNTWPTLTKIDTALSKPKGNAVANVKAEYNWNPTMNVAVSESGFANIPSKLDSYQSGYFMNLLSWAGDTICKFKDYDRDLDKAVSRTFRNPESTIYSQSKDQLLIRQCYNDTIFKLMYPNKLQPKYIVDFGGKGVNSAKEGMSPGVDLSNRFVVEDIKNINDFLLILYTQDYSCPNTAQYGTLKYNLYVFDKKRKQGYHAYIDAKPYLPPIPENNSTPSSWPQAPFQGIEDDIDGGVLSFYNVKEDSSGKIFGAYTGKSIKEQLGELKNNQTLDDLVKGCSDNDIFIAFYE